MDPLPPVIVNGSRADLDNPSGNSIFQDVVSGGLNVVGGLTELAADPTTNGLANLAYASAKVVLGGGPLKSIALQVGKVAESQLVQKAADYFSNQAQDAATQFFTKVARDNDLTATIKIAGQDFSIGSDDFGQAAGLLVGSVVNTVAGGALSGITERGATVNNIVRDERGRFKSDPLNPKSPYTYSDAQRRTDWKRLAQDPNSPLTIEQRAEIKSRGWRGPQAVNEYGELETMELSHEPVPLREGGKDVYPRWPADHAAVDPYRQLKKRAE
jgi:hypothetical protein